MAFDAVLMVVTNNGQFNRMQTYLRGTSDAAPTDLKGDEFRRKHVGICMGMCVTWISKSMSANNPAAITLRGAYRSPNSRFNVTIAIADTKTAEIPVPRGSPGMDYFFYESAIVQAASKHFIDVCIRQYSTEEQKNILDTGKWPEGKEPYEVFFERRGLPLRAVSTSTSTDILALSSWLFTLLNKEKASKFGGERVSPGSAVYYVFVSPGHIAAFCLRPNDLYFLEPETGLWRSRNAVNSWATFDALITDLCEEYFLRPSGPDGLLCSLLEVLP